VPELCWAFSLVFVSNGLSFTDSLIEVAGGSQAQQAFTFSLQRNASQAHDDKIM